MKKFNIFVCLSFSILNDLYRIGWRHQNSSDACKKISRVLNTAGNGGYDEICGKNGGYDDGSCLNYSSLTQNRTFFGSVSMNDAYFRG